MLAAASRRRLASTSPKIVAYKKTSPEYGKLRMNGFLFL
jgi:hypothetical protein